MPFGKPLKTQQTKFCGRKLACRNCLAPRKIYVERKLLSRDGPNLVESVCKVLLRVRHKANSLGSAASRWVAIYWPGCGRPSQLENQAARVIHFGMTPQSRGFKTEPNTRAWMHSPPLKFSAIIFERVSIIFTRALSSAG